MTPRVADMHGAIEVLRERQNLARESRSLESALGLITFAAHELERHALHMAALEIQLAELRAEREARHG